MSRPADAERREGRIDALLGVGLVAVTVYGVIVLPLRPWLLGQAPHLLAVVTGSRPALVAVGALAAAESAPWFWTLVAATCSIVKFHWVFWLAGRRWGEAALVRVSGDSPRARRKVERAESLVRRYRVPALWLTYVPIPVAREVVHVALGMSGASIRRLLRADLIAAAVTQTAALLLGVLLGEHAVAVVKEYAVYAGWGALAGLLGRILTGVRTWWQRRRTTSRTTE